MSTYRPSELIMDILARLPVKSLVRFKSVSKTWKSLMEEDPCFINMHMLISSKTQQLILQLNPTDPLLSMELDSLDKTKSVNLLPELERPYKDIVVIGSCNGLIAVRCYNNSEEDDIIIWNIATREAKIIPIIMPSATGRRHSGGTMGFGYDLVGDDYKVVVFYDADNELVSLVYSLKKNEWAWSRSIQSGFGTSVRGEGWLVNGAIHWIGWKETDDQEQIVAFDLGIEECRWIPLPASYYEVHEIEMGVLRGCLCINYIRSYEKGDYDIWMMKNYMKQESWTKLYSINTEVFTRPLAARENGQLLLLEYTENQNIILQNKNRLYWYDTLSKKQVQISEFLYISNVVLATVSMESLVRVNNHPMITGTRDNKPHLKQGNNRKQQE